jgi:hypothetical protein
MFTLVPGHSILQLGKSLLNPGQDTYFRVGSINVGLQYRQCLLFTRGDLAALLAIVQGNDSAIVRDGVTHIHDFDLSIGGSGIDALILLTVTVAVEVT